MKMEERRMTEKKVINPYSVTKMRERITGRYTWLTKEQDEDMKNKE